MADSTGSSGLDSLLEALKKSGVDVGNMTGDSAASSSSSGNSGASTSSTESSSGAQSKGSSGSSSSRRGSRASGFGGFGSSGGNGSNPFGGFPFGGFGGFGRNSSGDSDGPDAAADGSQGDSTDVAAEVINRVQEWSRKTIIIAAVVFILVLLAAYWWFHPPISINSVDTWFFVTVFVLLPIFLIFRVRSPSYETGTSKVVANPDKSKRAKTLSYLPLIVLVIGLLGGIASLDFFPGNAHKYATVLQTQQLNFAEDIQPVNYAEIPVIDHDSAVLLGNREMGSIPEYVSQFEIDDLYSQINYQGVPVRVSPLGYADLFKWLTNRENGIPAYVLVNMTTQDARIVTMSEGMKYTPSEPLARNIDRYVQLKYPFYIFDDKAFEIDEDGQPWWICPVRTYTIGLFGGETINRVVLCNAVTGECQDLAIEDVPQWVDRAYPSDLLIRQYNWSGSYINGWFNSWLGQAGVYQTTPGTNGENGYNYIAKDDDVWVYTGVTSATSDNSIIGFVLINQRTAESHYYSVAGATEDSAMSSAEGQVQHLRYTATFPLLINVANQPTYFMALKDAAGLVKQFAMIDIQRYQNVAVGDTVASCQHSYEELLVTNGALTRDEVVEVGSVETAAGVIHTMAQASIDGNSHFYLMLDGDSRIYDFALPGLVDIVRYNVGDAITFSYIEGEPTCTVQAIGEGDAARQDSSANASSGQSIEGDASGSASSAGALDERMVA